jgi:trehalose-phosphatase
MSEPLPLENYGEEILARLAKAPSVSLFLDFDGTLTPIVEEPGQARLSPETTRVLSSLSSLEGVLVAIVSGRSLADLCGRVGIESIVYAGNHGLEICGRGLNFVEPFAQRKSQVLPELCETLSATVHAVRGAVVENKGLTASVHYRRVAPEETADLERLVRAAVAPASSIFHIRPGKMVWEIVPRINWHKGAAICWINSRRAALDADSVIAGDDATDEHGFQLGADDITIRVGEPRDTAAKYFVPGVDGMLAFLARLLETRKGANASAGTGK